MEHRAPRKLLPTDVARCDSHVQAIGDRFANERSNRRTSPTTHMPACAPPGCRFWRMTTAPRTRFMLRCDSGAHRVALDPARYWHPVGCPVCKRPIDRRRIRRMGAFLAGRAPRSGVRFGGAFRLVPLDGLALLWAVVILLVTLLLHTVADAWWPATVLLFLGRWPWLLPAFPLFMAALILRQRRAALITLGTTVLALFGVMEFSLGLGRFVGDSDPDTRTRIITFNAEGDTPETIQIAPLVAAWDPDVLAVQECAERTRAQLSRMPGYMTDVGYTCLVTKFPIVAIDSLRRTTFAKAGGVGYAKRYRLRAPWGEFDLTNVHLDTPRKAFETLMDGRDDATGLIEEKTAVRNLESRLARRLVDQGPGPRLVAGDFNMPTESSIFREHWSSLTDGFAHAGMGFGSSRLAGWIRLRIDHVLADDGWVVKSARLLPDYGSDHLPVMVEVERRR